MSSPAIRPGVKRLGIFGGTFDPVHTGHLILARDILERAGLDHIVFLPAARNPLKTDGPLASGKDRADMLRAALRGSDGFSVSTVDIDRPPPSFALETVAALRREWPDACFAWIIGRDQLSGLHRWHRIDDLAAEVEFIVLRRPGPDTGLPERPSLRLRVMDTRLMELSSTEIRQRIAAGKSVDFFVPSAVIEVIDKRSLYATA
ncbi:MAG: nicotinate (nicotinamide) nucleotide adenylyltransferase [Opitutales bacterium]|nr:nicotinate (nicotinamide) nucleotide adenylyltransferase [Opitutales bacterium]